MSQIPQPSPARERPMRPRGRALLYLVAAGAMTALAAFVAQNVWRENGLRSLQAVNEQRVQLAANALRAEINRQDHLPVLLSFDADVLRALSAPGEAMAIDRLNRKLKRIAKEADARALYVVRPDGLVVASDDWDLAGSQVGRDLSDRLYVRTALGGGRGAFLGIEPASDRVRYYVASPAGDGIAVGVAVVRIEFDPLETAWESAGERVLVTDASGTVFLASDPAYKYRAIGSVAAPADEAGRSGLDFAGAPARPIEFEVVEQRGASQIVRIGGSGGETYLYQSMSIPEYGWTIHRLSDLATIHTDQRDGAIIGSTISILMISGLFSLLQRQRALKAARQAGARLTSEVAERTRELRDANASLLAEIDERRRAERQLRETQNNLVQAGKLAALGQMSAALAHEINQPLAAIRTFIASAKVYAARGDARQVAANLDLVNGLAERMAAITSHLKMFARKSDPGKPETVDVRRAVEGALFLIDGQIRIAKAQIASDIAPDLTVKGYAVQLEQVMVNLLQNALQAIADRPNPRIWLKVDADRDIVRFSVSDNGPGIAPDHIPQIFDPFFTTKPVGKGVGLGLSISYGIVRDFDGQIRAGNRPGGGAEIVVELPRFYPERALRHA
jgi:two-component system C4-dicarboxylate transport sensor histidine kinase DctB